MKSAKAVLSQTSRETGDAPRDEVPSPPEPARVWHLYVLRCADGSLYCGIAVDVTRRIAQHQSGKGAKYTRSRLPVTLIRTNAIGPLMADALKAERRFKALSRGGKLLALRSDLTGLSPAPAE